MKKPHLFAAIALAITSLFGASIAANAALPTTKTWTDAGLQEMFRMKGNLTWSADGLGIASGQTGEMQIEKPSGSTVIAAYLIVTAVDLGGFLTSPPSDVKINNAAVTFTHTAKETVTGGKFTNYLSDVTSNVKSLVDGSPAGIIDVDVDNGSFQTTRSTQSYITGDVLLVIFDTPSAPIASVVLQFGTSDPAGDEFSLGYPALSAPQTADLQMSIGSAFSRGGSEISTITVNGEPLTETAGGVDDCDSAENTCKVNFQSLITVGGVGDSTANPEAPLSTATDDELYSLSPFVNVGDTEVTVETLNPSNDDNLFMAFFYLKNVEITGATDAIPSALADTGANSGQLALLGGLAALSMVAGAAVVARRRKA